MAQGINSNLNNYMVQNTGIKQPELKKTIDTSTKVVSDSVESNALVNSAMGIDRESLVLVPGLIAMIKFINTSLMGGEEGKSLAGRIAKLGDKISGALKLDKANGLGEKISNFIKNNRFTKYFTSDYMAHPKNSMAKTVKMSEKYARAILETLEEQQVDVSSLNEAMKKGIKSTPTLVDDIIKVADDFIAANPKDRKISGLRNMLKAADGKIGKTSLGKIFAKSGIKAKEIAFSTSDFLDRSSFLMDFGSIVLFAGVLHRAAKESKEAPKGEKLSTFMHILSQDYAPLMIMQPATSLAYKLGGNKYRGMTTQGRQALADLVKTANDNVDTLKIAKMQQKLIKKGKDIDVVKTMTGKSFAQAKEIASTLDDGIISKVINFIKSPLKSIGKLLTPRPELTEQAKNAIKEIGEQAVQHKSKVKSATKVANIQKDLLLRGVDKDKVADLAGKGLKEARKMAKGLKKEGAKLKLWEKPLKFIGKILDTGLDTIKSPSKLGKIKNKLKGFGGGLGRFILILFVLQPLLQKPIQKICHKIFGEPKTYLAKEKAKEEAANPKPETQKPGNQNSTNLLEQWKIPKQQPQQIEKEQKQNTTEIVNEELAATNLSNNKKERYIPSIEVSYAPDNSEKEIEAQVSALLKSTENVMKNAQKYL